MSIQCITLENKLPDFMSHVLFYSLCLLSSIPFEPSEILFIFQDLVQMPLSAMQFLMPSLHLITTCSALPQLLSYVFILPISQPAQRYYSCLFPPPLGNSCEAWQGQVDVKNQWLKGLASDSNKSNLGAHKIFEKLAFGNQILHLRDKDNMG